MANATCGRCGYKTWMREAGEAVVIEPAEGYGDRQREEQAHACASCGRLSIRTVTYTYESDPDYSEVLNEEWIPHHLDLREFNDVPAHIAAAASEVTQCLSAGAYRAAGALARAVIEATAKEKGITSGQLGTKISAMHEQVLIRGHIKDAAHEVRHFGNNMAHGDFIDPIDKEEAAVAVELMCEVLNEVFQSPAKIARATAAREAKKQERRPG